MEVFDGWRSESKAVCKRFGLVDSGTEAGEKPPQSPLLTKESIEFFFEVLQLSAAFEEQKRILGGVICGGYGLQTIDQFAVISLDRGEVLFVPKQAVFFSVMQAANLFANKPPELAFACPWPAGRKLLG